MLHRYKAFLFRGNLLDLAVAFILGVAFAAVVTAFTDGVVMALIAAVFGQPSFDAVIWHVGDGQILVGEFLTALVNFLLVASVLFFLVEAAARFQRRPEEEETPDSDEVLVLREIRDLLQRSRG